MADWNCLPEKIINSNSLDSFKVDCSQSPIFPCDRRCGSWYLNASETGESTKCPWVEVVEGTAGGKNRETVTASLCLVFKGRGLILTPPLIKSINNLFPGEKACQIREI